VTLPGQLPGTPRERRQQPRTRYWRAVARWLIRLGVVAAFFAGGVAVGEALHDNPKPGGARTIERILKPLPIAPAKRTVTVHK
jgi:uncharacterized membrane protein